MSSTHVARSLNARPRSGAGRAARVAPRAPSFALRAAGAVGATALTGVLLYAALAPPGSDSPSPGQRRAPPDAVAAQEAASSPPAFGAPAPAEAQLWAALQRVASMLATSAPGEHSAAEPSSQDPAPNQAPALDLPADVAVRGASDPVSRAREELELLDAQQPEGFLTAMFTEHDQSFAATQVREAARRYIQRRTELLRRMLNAHLEAPLDYDGTEELAELEELATELTTSVMEFEDDFPGVARLSEVLSQTALPLPRFVQRRLAAAAMPASEEPQPGAGQRSPERGAALPPAMLTVD